VLDVMTTLARDGMTMVMVTHEMGFAGTGEPRGVHGRRTGREARRGLLWPAQRPGEDFLSNTYALTEIDGIVFEEGD
jgi:hypothetical protein